MMYVTPNLKIMSSFFRHFAFFLPHFLHFSFSFFSSFGGHLQGSHFSGNNFRDHLRILVEEGSETKFSLKLLLCFPLACLSTINCSQFEYSLNLDYL